MKRTGASRLTKKTKKMGGSTSNIISDLPCNIIEKILMCLPMQDAVRTSVLSRKWRYIWMKLPQLVFDDMFCRESIRTMKDKLINTIYQVMLLHRGPILKFTLSLPELESCSEIDQLILFLSINGIQEFALRIWKGEPYKLPSSLFSCLHINHLDLHSCVFKPPSGFKGFNRLLCLELREVVITADKFSSLISICPLLERLTFESSIRYKNLEIVAPNLRFILFECLFSSIRFKNTPHLAEVTIYTGQLVFNDAYKKDVSNSVIPLKSLPAIETLGLDYYYAKYMVAGGVLKRLPTTLNHLKILSLYEVCFGELDDVSNLLWIIRSSPNLEKLTIEAYTDDVTAATDSVLELLEVQGWPSVSLNQLREVEMLMVSGTRSELEFIKLLLAKSVLLDKMLIEPNSANVADKGLNILTKLTRFRRASTQVEITYKHPEEDQV